MQRRVCRIGLELPKRWPPVRRIDCLGISACDDNCKNDERP
jgi:hypothetical protein